jgi:hypothetical protein
MASVRSSPVGGLGTWAAVIAVVLASAGGATSAPPRSGDSGGRHPHFDDQGALVWYTSFAAAARAARAEGKVIFVDHGRLRCGQCRTLVQTVFPQPAVRQRLGAAAVGLASDCDDPEPWVDALLRRHLPAQMLPMCGFVTADGRWICGFEGMRPVGSFLQDVCQAERCTCAPAAKPKPTPKSAPPSAAPTPRTPARSTPKPAARPDAEEPRPPVAAPPIASLPVAPPVTSAPEPEPAAAEDAAPPRPLAPQRPLAPPVVTVPGSGPALAGEPAAPATTSTTVAPTTATPLAVPADEPGGPGEVIARVAVPRAPARLVVAPPAVWEGDPDGDVPPPPRTALPDARSKAGRSDPPRVLEAPVLVRRGAAPRGGLLQRAETASSAGRWGEVVGLAREARRLRHPDTERLEAMAQDAHDWAHERLAHAVAAAERGETEAALAAIAQVQKEMRGEPEGIDADRGETAIRRRDEMRHLRPDGLVYAAVQRNTWEEMRGSQWETLFR